MRDHVHDLVSRGFASDDLFEKLAELWEQLGETPACMICFQLPHQLHVTPLPYTVRSPRQTVPVTLYFHGVTAKVGSRLKYQLVESDELEATDLRFECTQGIAVVPLWGTRHDYYPDYLELLRRNNLKAVLIRGEDSPYQGHMLGSVTGDMFEVDAARRAMGEAIFALRRFLKDYAVTTLHEVERPTQLLSVFASIADERFFPLDHGESVVRGLLRPSRSFPLKVATPEEIGRAAKWELRDFSVFESQIFALRRLADSGDPGLALIGLCALVEWFLTDNLPKNVASNLPLRRLIDHDHYAFLGRDNRDALHLGRSRRNILVHERPTETRYLQMSLSHFTDVGDLDDSAATTMGVFQATALAAFECFRLVNINRARVPRVVEPES